MVDKIEKAGWHATKSDFVDAPLLDELIFISSLAKINSFAIESEIISL